MKIISLGFRAYFSFSYNVGRISTISLLLSSINDIDFDVFKDIKSGLSSSSLEENSLRRGVCLEEIIKNPYPRVYLNSDKNKQIICFLFLP